jgi:hypothetical protein
VALALAGRYSDWHNAGMDTASDQPHKVTMQLPQSLIAAMKALAKKHRRSFTGEVVWALQQYVSHQQQQQREEEQQA